MKTITIELDEAKHAAFKSKAAAASLSMRDVLAWAIDDYLADKWKARPRDRQQKEGKPIK